MTSVTSLTMIKECQRCNFPAPKKGFKLYELRGTDLNWFNSFLPVIKP